jgi:hypothetical protein
MTAHLLLPYNWADCAETENCPQYIHLQDTAETLNDYPISWVETLLQNCTITEEKITFHNKNNQLHRDDGPAMITVKGRIDWCLNGKVHRENGPAVTLPDGTQQWRQDGKLHRTDGPAIERSDGRKEWYIHGKLIPPPSHTQNSNH